MLWVAEYLDRITHFGNGAAAQDDGPVAHVVAKRPGKSFQRNPAGAGLLQEAWLWPATARLDNGPVLDLSFRQEDITAFFDAVGLSWRLKTLTTDTKYRIEHIFYVTTTPSGPRSARPV
jgi:hypothetical protein